MEDLTETADAKVKDFGDLEREVHLQETDPAKYLEFGTEIWRGHFSLIRNVESKDGMKAKYVAKIMVYDSSKPEESLREYNMLKSVRQEHIVRLHEAYLSNEFVFLVFEKLYGENIVRSLSLKNKYNEQTVTDIIKQVLDAVQFLHHRGIVHLNIQPDNVIMQSRRRFDVKLVDFGLANKITTIDGEPVERIGAAEFMAPEKVAGENVGVAADIWNIGVLTFILLSGVSPFNGESQADTFANIKHVRYDANVLYHNVTKYSMKFLYQTLKRNPRARLTTEECLDHRWLMLNPAMVKTRKATVFSTDKLKYFLDDYTYRRMRDTRLPDRLVAAYGADTESFTYDEEEYFANRRLSQTKF